jgi:hypothetical protein
MTTLDSDWARFTENDLREATARLRRVSDSFRLRIAALSAAEYESQRGQDWSIRAITEHLIEGISEYTAQAPTAASGS